MSDVFARGGEGGVELARAVLAACEEPAQFAPLYDDDLPLKQKIETLSRRVYGAAGVQYTAQAESSLCEIERLGGSTLPICVAKTQYSLSDDPAKLGRPIDFDITVREVRLSAGAGFIVALTGAIMTMPGLPKKPAACSIDVDAEGNITGLF